MRGHKLVWSDRFAAVTVARGRVRYWISSGLPSPGRNVAWMETDGSRDERIAYRFVQSVAPLLASMGVKVER